MKFDIKSTKDERKKIYNIMHLFLCSAFTTAKDKWKEITAGKQKMSEVNKKGR